MEKIKSLQELQIKKNSIEQEQNNLRKQLTNDWHELKESASPGKIARDIYLDILRKRTERKKNNFLKGILNDAVNLLVDKIITKD